MRIVATTTLVLALMLAGCAETPETPSEVNEGNEEPDAPLDVAPIEVVDAPPQELAFGACTIQGVQMAFPRSLAESFMPPGFELVPFPGDPTGATVLLESSGLHCEEVDGNRTGDVLEYRLYFHVEPPEIHRSPDVSVYWIQVFGILSDGAVLQTYNDWNLTWGLAGNVAMETQNLDPLWTGSVVAEAEGTEGAEWSLRLDTAVESTPTCYEDMVYRSFAWNEEYTEPTNYVDGTLSPCITMGAGNIQFELWSADPDVVAFWLMTSAVTHGFGFHIDGGQEPMEFIQHYVPLS